MEAQTITQPTLRYITVGENYKGSRAICKCGKGFKCVITKTDGADAGKTYECDGGDCICVIGGSENGEEVELRRKIESAAGDSVYCECGEGWSCVITKIDEDVAAPPASSCGQACKC